MRQKSLDTLDRLINSETSMMPDSKGVIKMLKLLKEASIETIKRLPDECTAEDIMYEVNFIAQVLEGLKDAEAGRLVTTDELLNRVGQWAKEDGRKRRAATFRPSMNISRIIPRSMPHVS